jgi:hypothetical protein
MCADRKSGAQSTAMALAAARAGMKDTLAHHGFCAPKVADFA